MTDHEMLVFLYHSAILSWCFVGFSTFVQIVAAIAKNSR